MARRTGLPTLMKLSLRMCDIINRYSAIILLAYPTSTALHAAVAAAGAACAELKLQVAEVLPEGV